MTQTSVPSDIWSRVFQHVCADSSHLFTTSRAIALAQVCTTWKVIAEPYIYRDIYFDDLLRLQRAGQVFGFSGRGEKVARWTRTLEINVMDYGEQASHSKVGASIAIALHARQLVELSVGCFAPPEGLLSVVGSVAAASLRCLDLSCGIVGMPAFMLSSIGVFAKLQTLRLELFTSEQAILLDLLPLNEVESWKFHELEKLVIDFEALSDDDRHQTSIQLLRFLSRCTLGRPNRLCLSLMGFVDEDALALEDFFCAHSALHNCRVVGCDADILDIAFLHANTAYLQLYGIPSIRDVVTLNPGLRTLCLRSFDEADIAPLEGFIACLEDSHHHNAKRLQLHLPSFRWTRTDSAANDEQEELALVGRMYRCAHRLRPHGIIVIDCAGYTFDGLWINLTNGEF